MKFYVIDTSRQPESVVGTFSLDSIEEEDRKNAIDLLLTIFASSQIEIAQVVTAGA